jgi:Tol biopolymer transport system component
MSALPTPLPVPRINEIFVRPKWAPNGKKVIFYARRYAEREFLVLPLNGGTAQRLSGLEFDPGGYCWMGNDALLIRRTSRRPIQSKLIRVDLATRSEAILMTTKDAGGILGNMTCSQDGKLVFIKQVYEVSGKLLDLNTNSETSVLLPNNLRSADVPISADGKNLLFIAGNDGAQAIFIMPTSGGKPRELLKVTGPEELQLTYGLAWSPDGRYVYFVKRANRDKDFELFRISTSEGKEEPLGLSGIDLRDLDVSPDGSRIAFSLGKLNRSEVYAVENFLPNARDSR